MVDTCLPEGKMVVDTSVPEGKSVVDTSVPEGKSVVDTSVREGKAVVDTSVCEGKVVVDTSVPEGKAVVDTSVPEGKAVVDTSVPEGKAVVDTSVPEGKAVVDTSVREGKAVVDTSVPEGKVVVDTSVREGKVVVDTSVPEGKVVVDTSLPEGKVVVDTSLPEGKVVVDTSVPEGKVVVDTSLPEGKAVVDTSVLEEKVVDTSVLEEKVVDASFPEEKASPEEQFLKDLDEEVDKITSGESILENIKVQNSPNLDNSNIQTSSIKVDIVSSKSFKDNKANTSVESSHITDNAPSKQENEYNTSVGDASVCLPVKEVRNYDCSTEGSISELNNQSNTIVVSNVEQDLMISHDASNNSAPLGKVSRSAEAKNLAMLSNCVTKIENNSITPTGVIEAEAVPPSNESDLGESKLGTEGSLYQAVDVAELEHDRVSNNLKDSETESNISHSNSSESIGRNEHSLTASRQSLELQSGDSGRGSIDIEMSAPVPPVRRKKRLQKVVA